MFPSILRTMPVHSCRCVSICDWVMYSVAMPWFKSFLTENKRNSTFPKSELQRPDMSYIIVTSIWDSAEMAGLNHLLLSASFIACFIEIEFLAN